MSDDTRCPPDVRDLTIREFEEALYSLGGEYGGEEDYIWRFANEFLAALRLSDTFDVLIEAAHERGWRPSTVDCMGYDMDGLRAMWEDVRDGEDASLTDDDLLRFAAWENQHFDADDMYERIQADLVDWVSDGQERSTNGKDQPNDG